MLNNQDWVRTLGNWDAEPCKVARVEAALQRRGLGLETGGGCWLGEV